MFIAMRFGFGVKRGTEDAFEKVWLSRESYLERVPGFVGVIIPPFPRGVCNDHSSGEHVAHEAQLC